jgi:hypothetical protein
MGDAPQLPVCNCKPAKAYPPPRTSNTPKNPGRQFYSCDDCQSFCWVDQYGKPKPAWGGKRKDAPSSSSGDEDRSFKLRIEEKLDQILQKLA